MTTPPTAADRTLDAMRRLVTSFFPALRFYIVHEYAVQASSVDSDGVAVFSALPTDPTFSPPLPVGVPYSPSLAGSSCVVPVGTLAYVGFANADGGKPYVVRFGPGVATSATVDAGAIKLGDARGTVVREGDTVLIFPGGMGGPVSGVVSITLGQGMPPTVSKVKA